MDDLLHALQAWRVWLVAALLGALLGQVFHTLFPPDFRARATVTVNHNLEQAWPDAGTERELMTYLARETGKLVEVAWADETLALVVEKVPGTRMADLRGGVLQLSQPADGAWHFWADDPQPEQAQALAGAWATAFYQQTLQGVETSTQLRAAQTALEESPSDELVEKISEFESATLAVSPYLQVSLSQVSDLPVGRTYGTGTATLAGLLLGWALSLLVLLFIGKPGEGA